MKPTYECTTRQYIVQLERGKENVYKKSEKPKTQGKVGLINILLLQNQEKICITNEATREEVVSQCVFTVGPLQLGTARVCAGIMWRRGFVSSSTICTATT